MIQLESIDATRPSTYNPRSADPARLDLIELSLRKLEFLAPIFADANGVLTRAAICIGIQSYGIESVR